MEICTTGIFHQSLCPLRRGLLGWDLSCVLTRIAFGALVAPCSHYGGTVHFFQTLFLSRQLNLHQNLTKNINIVVTAPHLAGLDKTLIILSY